MKILTVCQYYYPEPFRINDICEELVNRGHDVTVVTGTPNYPMGEVYEGYENGSHADEVLNGVKIHRVKIIPRKTGALHRFLNYYSFANASTKYIKRLGNDYDVVFVNQLSPVMMAKAAVKYKKNHSKKLVLYCLDLWPESLVAGGIKRASPIYKFFHKISANIYTQADKILITSKKFADYFKNEFNILNTGYLPQYAESLFKAESCRKEPDDRIDLMFAGNLGTAQSVNTIIEAAKLMKDVSNLYFHIVGDGSEFNSLKQQAIDVPNVIFHGRKSLEEMPNYYAKADAMLVTLSKDPVISLTLPGKVQTYMSAGKPIIGAIDGETQIVIKEANCGFCGPAEDSAALAENIRKFMLSNKDEKGKNAKSYYDEHFQKKTFIDKLEKELLN